MDAFGADPFDPQNPLHWIRILHNAALVQRGDPKYADAQDAIDLALTQIQHLNRVANEADRREASPAPNAHILTTIGGELANSLGAGTGEAIAGMASDPHVRALDTFIPGMGAVLALARPTGARSFGEGANAYREGLENLRESNAVPAAWAGVGGDALLTAATMGAAPIRAASGLTPRTVLSGSEFLGRMGRGAAPAGVQGFLQGFSAGGEDPGDMGARLRRGGKTALVDAALAAALTGLSLREGRRVTERGADMARKANEDRLAALRVAEAEAQTTPPNGGTAQALARHFGVPVEQITRKGATAPVRQAYEVSRPIGPTRYYENGVEVPPPAPPAPTPEPPPTLGVPTRRPGHAVWYGEQAPTRSPEVRGGEPLTPPGYRGGGKTGTTSPVRMTPEWRAQQLDILREHARLGNTEAQQQLTALGETW